jgi:hypothetical protein
MRARILHSEHGHVQDGNCDSSVGDHIACLCRSVAPRSPDPARLASACVAYGVASSTVYGGRHAFHAQQWYVIADSLNVTPMQIDVCLGDS